MTRPDHNDGCGGESDHDLSSKCRNVKWAPTEAKMIKNYLRSSFRVCHWWAKSVTLIPHGGGSKK